MRRLWIPGLLFLALPAFGQPIRIVPEAVSGNVKSVTLMSQFDLDGEAADADQVVTAANGVFVDSKTDYTITAQPDVCRLLDITVIDTDLSAGTLTITGTDCLGYAKVCSWSATAGDDTGVHSLTCTDGQGAYYKTVTGVETDEMTGESDESFSLGYTTNSANGWGMWGTLLPAGPSGEHGVDPFAATLVTTKVTTSGVLTTNLAGTGAFTNVLAGDMLIIPETDDQGNVVNYERTVATRSSDDAVVLNAAINIPTAGVVFYYKHWYFSTNPADHLYLNTEGYKSLALNYSVDSNTDTGGVVATFECTDHEGPTFPTGEWISVDTLTTASAGTQAPTLTDLGPVDLTAAPFKYCRVGLKFGTGDDDDTGIEAINLSATLSK